MRKAQTAPPIKPNLENSNNSKLTFSKVVEVFSVLTALLFAIASLVVFLKIYLLGLLSFEVVSIEDVILEGMVILTYPIFSLSLGRLAFLTFAFAFFYFAPKIIMEIGIKYKFVWANDVSNLIRAYRYGYITALVCFGAYINIVRYVTPTYEQPTFLTASQLGFQVPEICDSKLPDRFAFNGIPALPIVWKGRYASVVKCSKQFFLIVPKEGPSYFVNASNIATIKSPSK